MARLKDLQCIHVSGKCLDIVIASDVLGLSKKSCLLLDVLTPKYIYFNSVLCFSCMLMADLCSYAMSNTSILKKKENLKFRLAFCDVKVSFLL